MSTFLDKYSKFFINLEFCEFLSKNIKNFVIFIPKKFRILWLLILKYAEFCDIM